MPKEHILEQLQIGSWAMIPRKCEEMNHAVAAWLEEDVKPLPRIVWYGAFSNEPGTDGMISEFRGDNNLNPVIHIRCNPGRTQIRETLYHELLHYYLPDETELTVRVYEEFLITGHTYDQARLACCGDPDAPGSYIVKRLTEANHT
jgi:hypothetical protein